VVLGAFAAAVIVALATAGVWLPALGRWLALPATAEPHGADAIVVHGGNPARTEYGIELYQRGLAPELWHTGYSRNQAHTFLTVVTNGGVPTPAYHFLATTSTWSDGHEIAETIKNRKLHSVLIVTDWWHSRRALCATEQQLQGYDVAIEFESAPTPAGVENWWRDSATRKEVLTELVKLGYYAMRYRMAPWGC
jgi:uncharacterized SAM-binding protein YcdF (DUF218 family)